MTNTKHTEGKFVATELLIFTEDGKVIASLGASSFGIETDAVNAAEIVRRWNAHEELVEVLEKISEQLECPARNTTRSSHRRDGSVIISSDLREAVRAAILKAKGPQ